MAVCGGGKRLGEGDVGIDPIRQEAPTESVRPVASRPDGSEDSDE